MACLALAEAQPPPRLQRLPVAAGGARATFPRVWGIEMRIAPPPRARRLRWARRPQRGGQTERRAFFSAWQPLAVALPAAVRAPTGRVRRGASKGRTRRTEHGRGCARRIALSGERATNFGEGRRTLALHLGRRRSRKRALMAVPLCGVTDLVQGTPHSPPSAACGKSMLIPSLRGRGMPSFWPARRMVGASA